MINLKTNPLKYVLENNLVLDGTWIEFGVFNGRTINYISQFTKNKIYGLDTFTGLPDKWDVSDDVIVEKGYYSFEDFIGNTTTKTILPLVNDNVVLIKGLFSDTLPQFLSNQKISFMHIDCDTYESTIDIFDNVTSNVIDGCVIVFDEFINYPNYYKHEFLAFNEWVDKYDITYEYIGINGEFYEKPNKIYDKELQKVAIRIIKNPNFKND
jgi:hypothetical protein